MVMTNENMKEYVLQGIGVDFARTYLSNVSVAKELLHCNGIGGKVCFIVPRELLENGNMKLKPPGTHGEATTTKRSSTSLRCFMEEKEDLTLLGAQKNYLWLKKLTLELKSLLLRNMASLFLVTLIPLNWLMFFKTVKDSR